MEEMNPSVLEVIEAMAKAYPGDIDRAVEMAERQVRRLESYEALVRGLVRVALRTKIHDFRHAQNVKARREAGLYSSPAKVSSASASTAATYRCIYDRYYLGGQLLGDLSGKELAQVEVEEAEAARGHLFNRDLVRWLREHGVTEDKRVREVFSTPTQRKALDAEFRRLYKAAMERSLEAQK